jgi:uncharacterized protein YqfA (UPF0365 family)
MSRTEVAEAVLGAANGMRVVLATIVVIFVVVGLVFVLLFLRFFKLWLQAKLSGADVAFAALIGMRLRKSDYRAIVLSRITAVQAGLELSILDLESHYLAGGHVPRVVRALILAHRKNIELSWKEATEIDLEGRDVLAEVQSAADGAGEPGVEERPPLCFGDAGVAVSLLEPQGQARFGQTTVEVVAEGLFIEAGAKVEIVEVIGDKIVVRRIEG